MLTAGSMPKFAWLPVLVSSQTRALLFLPLTNRPCEFSILSYDIFAINIASPMLGYNYGRSEYSNNIAPDAWYEFQCKIGQKLNVNQDLGIKVATPVGNVFGQVAFGFLADHLGRKRMCKTLSTITCYTVLIFSKTVLN